jgi:DNA-binding NarL/FixJ family response regulator
MAGPLVTRVLVDANALVRSAVRYALTASDIEIVGETSNAEEALSLAQARRPDIVLVDLDLPDSDGFVLIAALGARLPRAKVIALSDSSESRDVVRAVRAGAAGYLTKDLSPEALLRSILGARDGDLPMPRRLAAVLVAQLARSAGPIASGESEGLERLTPREAEVLRMISAGLTDREVAQSLGLSIRTVETHVSNLLHKLGARNRADAARLHGAST